MDHRVSATPLPLFAPPVDDEAPAGAVVAKKLTKTPQPAIVLRLSRNRAEDVA